MLKKLFVIFFCILTFMIISSVFLKDIYTYQLLKLAAFTGCSLQYSSDTKFALSDVVTNFVDIKTPFRIDKPDMEKVVRQTLTTTSKHLERGENITYKNNIMILNKPVSKSMCAGYAALFKFIFDNQIKRYGLEAESTIVYGNTNIPGILTGGHYWIRIDSQGKTRWVDPSMHDRIGVVFVDPLVKVKQ